MMYNVETFFGIIEISAPHYLAWCKHQQQSELKYMYQSDNTEMQYDTCNEQCLSHCVTEVLERNSNGIRKQ